MDAGNGLVLDGQVVGVRAAQSQAPRPQGHGDDGAVIRELEMGFHGAIVGPRAERNAAATGEFR